MKKFKKYIQADFVEAIKNTPFGPIFMAFYNEEFGGEKALKSKVWQRALQKLPFGQKNNKQ